jgi:hypothetical protein
MSASILKQACWLLLATVVSGARGVPPVPMVNKTMRVDHGRPVVMVSQKSVLVLEFIKEPIADALVPHAEPDIRHCRAKYRYRLYDEVTGSLTNGEGMVEEVIQRDVRTGIGKNVGSHTSIGAGEFGMGWSEGGAGSRSWLYYRANSAIRFIQQPQHMTFEAMDREQCRRYLASKNVTEFVAAGKSVQVIGPAVFSGDLPTDAPVSGHIESGRVKDGVFELKLSDLATNQHYIIETSYELNSGSWNPVTTFIADKPNHEWSDVLGRDIDVTFYRIRQGPY